jgi:hypothetical protein
MIKNIAMHLAVIVVFSLSTAGLAAADPADLSGSYAVAGWNPGSDTSGTPDYTGSVELAGWGEAWKYRGDMDGHSYVGVGVYDEETRTLSLSFCSGDGTESGVTMLKAVPDGFSGKWVFAGVGDGACGTEAWTRKP